jgi:hypothetical protein
MKMKPTRTRVVLGIAAVFAAAALTASAPASASQPGLPPASVYCDYLNHVPGGEP